MKRYFSIIFWVSLWLFGMNYIVFGTEQTGQRTRYIPNQPSDDEFYRSIDTDFRTLFQTVQGRIAFGESTDGVFGENIDGQFQVVADTGSANTEFEVTHTLNRVPNGYLVVKNSKNGVVYDGTSSNTASSLFLRHGAANAAVTVFIF